MKTFVSVLALTLFLFDARAQEISINNQAYTDAEINSAFELARSIPFYSYGDLDNYPYKSIYFPYCAAGAAVIGDQVQKKIKKQVGQSYIFFTDAYTSHCKYPTAYGWHTFITIKRNDGELVAIDPAHTEGPLLINDYLQIFIENDCQNLSLKEMESLSKNVNTSALYIQRIDNDGHDFNDEVLEVYRQSNLNEMMSGIAQPLPVGPQGLFGVPYGDTMSDEQKFLNENLKDRHFLYVYHLSSKVSLGSMSSVNSNISQDFLDAAYTWVLPTSLIKNEPTWSYEAMVPFVTESTFETSK